MFTDVMIDLETMGTAPDSPILSIGLVAFDLGQPANYTMQRELHVSLNDSLRLGFKPSADTMLWWMAQSEAARLHTTLNQKCPFSVLQALDEVCEFFAQLNDYRDKVRVWGNGADFDIVLLGNYFRRLDIEPPWEFYNVRCFRTMKNMFPDVPKPTFDGIRHSAVSDALHQVNHLQDIVTSRGLHGK